MNGVLRRLIAWLLALVIGSVVPGAAVVAAAACIYDAQPAARSDVHQFTAAGVGQSQLRDALASSTSPAVEGRRASTTPITRSVATKPGTRFTVDADGVVTDAMGASSKGLVGTQYEDFLGTNLGGRTNVSYGGRQFDVEVPGGNGMGSTLIEAKSGNYWDLINSDPQLMLKFKNQAGSGAAIARQQGSQYLVYSNTPIPPAIQSWLTGKGIGFRVF